MSEFRDMDAFDEWASATQISITVPTAVDWASMDDCDFLFNNANNPDMNASPFRDTPATGHKDSLTSTTIEPFLDDTSLEGGDFSPMLNGNLEGILSSHLLNSWLPTPSIDTFLSEIDPIEAMQPFKASSDALKSPFHVSSLLVHTQLADSPQ